MSSFVRNSGVKVKNPNGLKKMKRTPEGVAIANIPGFDIFFDPRYADGNSVRNCKQYRNNVPITTGVAQFSEINGRRCFNLVDEIRVGAGGEIKGAINTEAVTAFTVVQSLGVSSVNRNYIFRPNVQMDDVIAPVFAFVTVSGQASAVIYENSLSIPGQPQRLNQRFDALLDAEPHFVMWTASVENGLSIWIDGERMAQDATDKRPFDFGTNSGDMGAFISTKGMFGKTGLINVDLNSDNYNDEREAIEAFMGWRYGITELKAKYPNRPEYFDLDNQS